MKKKRQHKMSVSGKAKNILKPTRKTVYVFVAIIAVHTILSFGLASGSVPYWLFISIIYGIFNLPLLFTFFSISAYSVYNLSAYVLLPLIGHVAYWWIVSSFIAAALNETNSTLRYKYAFYIVLYFLVASILFAIIFSIAAGDTIANSSVRYSMM